MKPHTPKAKTYNITPMPYTIRTHQGRFSDKAKRYHAWLEHARRMRITFPPAGANIVFIIPMPASWGKHKRFEMCGEPHTQTPDLSNLLKALEDAVYHKRNKDRKIRNDKIISSYGKVEKIWGTKGAIVIKSIPPADYRAGGWAG